MHRGVLGGKGNGRLGSGKAKSGRKRDAFCRPSIVAPHEMWGLAFGVKVIADFGANLTSFLGDCCGEQQPPKILEC
jgi:hypothetical protein